LKELNLHNNYLNTIPKALSNLANLETLYLGANYFTEVPESFGQLARLQFLYLFLNRLTAIPDSLGELTNLQYLDLSNNKLTAIPDSLGQLANLQSLALSNNKLTAVPDSLGQLAKLRQIDLSFNALTAIPESLAGLPNLTTLFVQGNPGLGIPDEICVSKTTGSGKPPKEIFNYYFSKLAGARPLNEAKLILVGQGGVGKTSLVKTLTGQKFKKGEKTTEGIKISDWACPLNREDKVTVHIWDFGGQEMMHATHQFFLTARSLYLLVLNRRPGAIDREADYWFGWCGPLVARTRR
jgi:internalin A